MKIAIPTVEGKLCMHFGHCQVFTFLVVDKDAKTIGEVTTATPPPHEPGVLPRWLKEQGADLIIAGGMGSRAQMLFAESGIEVVVGAPSDEARAVVEAWLAGALATGENACAH